MNNNIDWLKKNSFNDKKEKIVPPEYGGAIRIDFSSHLIDADSPSTRRLIFRYSFKNDDFKNVSLGTYADFLETFSRFIGHRIIDRPLTQKDENFLFEANLFRRDEIVLQFSVSGYPEESTHQWIQREVIDVFLSAIMIHKMNGIEWNLSEEKKKNWIIDDFINQKELDGDMLFSNNAMFRNFIDKWKNVVDE